MSNDFAYLAAAVLVIAVFAAGCVQDNGTNAAADESTKNITNNTLKERSIFYTPANYSAEKEISEPDIDYPVILENPVIRIPVRFYINYSTVNYSYSVFYHGMVDDVIDGLRKWENATKGKIRMTETKNLSDAVVVINFVKNYDIANLTSTEYGLSWTQQQGEGGPRRYSNYRGFSIIEKSEIFIFPQRENRCETVELAEHEFGHAMGLGHESDLRSVMFKRGSEYCNQIFTPLLLAALDSLYKDAKPDLRFRDVLATQAENVSMKFEVRNIGLADSVEVGLFLSDETFVTEAARVPPLGPGETLNISADFEPTIDRGVVYAYIDLDNAEDEISREDNTIVLKKG